MQIFKNMLMLHTDGEVVAGWCGLNDGPEGAEITVEVHGAPQGQMEVVLFAKTGEITLGTMETSGRSARGNWRYAGTRKDIEGVRVAHRTVQYIAKGGVMPGKKAYAVKKEETRIAKEAEAVPIPVVIEPVPMKLVMKKQEERAREADAGKTAAVAAAPKTTPQPGREEPWAERVGMRLFDGFSGGAEKGGPEEKGPGPAGGDGAQAPADGYPIKNGTAGEDVRFAQAGMRLTDSRTETGETDGRKGTPAIAQPTAGTAATVPAGKGAPLPLMEMPQAPEGVPDTGGDAEVTNARIKALLERAQKPLSGEEATAGAPQSAKEATEGTKKVPGLIEVLTLSDVSRSGVEEMTLGAGSGKKGALGQGVWWRVEHPGADGWHYLAGELTAKNGARVRAIALSAECDELPDHLRGWAQKAGDYFVVLIDAKTGAVLPEDAC